MLITVISHLSRFFFVHDPSNTEIYTLSLHDALPISSIEGTISATRPLTVRFRPSNSTLTGAPIRTSPRDRKSTRLNSSHVEISYAVFCLKKKKTRITDYMDSIT